MLDSTKNVFLKTVREIKLFTCVVTVLSQLITIGYMIYACVVGTGLLPVNIILAVVSLGYLVIYVATYGTKNRAHKKLRSAAATANRRMKLVGKTVTLGITIYGIYLSTEETTAISIILATLSIIFWILQVIFEILYSYVKRKAEEFVDALKNDVATAIEPVKKVGEFVKGVADTEVVGKVKELAGAAGEKIKDVKSFFKRNPFFTKKAAQTPEIEDNRDQAEDPVVNK